MSPCLLLQQPHVARHSIFDSVDTARKVSFGPKAEPSASTARGTRTEGVPRTRCSPSSPGTAPHPAAEVPEVRGELELVSHVGDAPAEVRGVHGDEDPSVAGSLRPPHQRLRRRPVLVHVQLQPAKAGRSRLGHLLDGWGGPGAQHHPCPHGLAGWRNTEWHSLSRRVKIMHLRLPAFRMLPHFASQKSPSTLAAPANLVQICFYESITYSSWSNLSLIVK